MFNGLLSNEDEVFDMNLGIITSYFVEQEKLDLENALTNANLKIAFEKASSSEYNEEKIVRNFKIDLLKSIEIIKSKMGSINSTAKNQILFLEYDYFPYATLSGFGQGDYPLLKKPSYLKYNYEDEFYLGIGKIDFTEIWKDLNHLNQLLEELDIYDHIGDTELYRNIREAIINKTFILLHHAFDEIGIVAFDGIPIELPFMIYGNEHDCEFINIYTYE